MDFVLLGHWRVKRYKCNCCFFSILSFGRRGCGQRTRSLTWRVTFRPQLFKRWIALSSGWILYLVDNAVGLVTLIHYCIGLFPVDSSIPFLNNWGQMKMAFMINAKSEDVMMMTLLMIKGSFSIGDGSESVTFKWIRFLSNFVAFIPIRWKCLM